jgi:hypothetical protein
MEVKGYVHWELLDEDDNLLERGEGQGSQWWIKWLPYSLRKYIPYGKRNAVVNTARSQIATFLQSGSGVVAPSFVGVGTGSDNVAAADTALGTAVAYTGGSATAKAVNSRTIMDQYTVRYIASFSTNELTQSLSSINIREFGLFSTSSVTSNMWARVNVDITKENTQKLNVYWYIVFERRTGLAIKSGASIQATGNITANTSTALTFASPVTIVTMHNDTGQKAWFRFNEALAGSPPTNYDVVLEDGQSWWMSAEEIEITTVHIYVNAAINISSGGHNSISVRGW